MVVAVFVRQSDFVFGWSENRRVDMRMGDEPTEIRAPDGHLVRAPWDVGVTAAPAIVEDIAKATYESYWPGSPWPNPEMSKEVETAWYRLAQAALNVVRERLK